MIDNKQDCGDCSNCGGSSPGHGDSSCGTSNGCSGDSCPKKGGTTYYITFENGESHNCRLIAKIEVNGQEYVVLEHPEKSVQILYRYHHHHDQITLECIEGEEFDFIAKVFQSTQ